LSPSFSKQPICFSQVSDAHVITRTLAAVE
jgi:hypothetical protein